MIKDRLEQIIQEALAQLQAEGKLAPGELPLVILEHPENLDHGDYSTNVAFALAPKLNKSPLETAEFLLEHIRFPVEGTIEVHRMEIAGPGFINLYLSGVYLAEELIRIIKEEKKYGSQRRQKRTMIIDYSGPNIAKSFGIGHLRSTIIGQALYNLYSFLGWKVVGDNHIGDWGTPHGKILYEIYEKMLKGRKDKERKEILNNLTVQDLEQLYIQFGKEAEVNPDLEQEARAWFQKLEKGDKEARLMWEYSKEASLAEFRRIYSFLDVAIEHTLGESFYEPMIKKVLREIVKKGVAVESEGALVIFYPEEKLPPALVLKSDGTTTYFLRDLATIAYRLKKWKPDVIVYETGVEQALNFQQLFWAAELLGWAPRNTFVHVAHGLYKTKEGKFSTRKGRTVHLEEVLQEAVARARHIVEASESAQKLSDIERSRVTRAVGIGGVKYNDLMQHPRKDIVFDWEKILNLKGNSAPYVQYTYARCQSIVEKAGFRWPSKNLKSENFSAAELSVMRFLYRFPEVVQEAAERFSPNLVCQFAFELAQNYNTFYGMHPVINAPTKEEMEFRLVLTAATAQVLKNSLTILGIQTLERM